MSNLPVAEACLRNQSPIAQQLESIFLNVQTVLELGSGTGQHAVFVCKAMPQLLWQPSELPERIHEVEAWRASENLDNVLPCKSIDVLDAKWDTESNYDAIFTANTVHFIGQNKVDSMLQGVSKRLEEGGLFVVYGPFNIDGQYISEGNRSLDAWLKQRDPESGIKDLADFKAQAKELGLEFVEKIQMPANNFMLQFKKN